MFFFPCLFPCYYHSVVYRVVSIVSDGYNQSPFMFSMLSSSRCINASTLSSMLQVLFLPLFLIHMSTSSVGCNALCMVIYYCYWFFLWFFYPFQSFSHQCYLIVFRWSLSGRKSPQVTGTLLSILAVLNNAVVWIVFTHPIIIIIINLLPVSFT